jgi:hypothetical protein
VRKAYDALFKAIKLTVKFNVAEIVEMSHTLPLGSWSGQ